MNAVPLRRLVPGVRPLWWLRPTAYAARAVGRRIVVDRNTSIRIDGVAAGAGSDAGGAPTFRLVGNGGGPALVLCTAAAPTAPAGASPARLLAELALLERVAPLLDWIEARIGQRLPPTRLRVSPVPPPPHAWSVLVTVIRRGRPGQAERQPVRIACESAAIANRIAGGIAELEPVGGRAPAAEDGADPTYEADRGAGGFIVSGWRVVAAARIDPAAIGALRRGDGLVLDPIDDADRAEIWRDHDARWAVLARPGAATDAHPALELTFDPGDDDARVPCAALRGRDASGVDVVAATGSVDVDLTAFVRDGDHGDVVRRAPPGRPDPSAPVTLVAAGHGAIGVARLLHVGRYRVAELIEVDLP